MYTCIQLRIILNTYQFLPKNDGVILFSAAVIPPYIPSVTAPDDTSNFDQFETQRDCGETSLPTPQQTPRGHRGFSGQSLPFIGFTFTRVESVNLDLRDHEEKYAYSPM